jgi:hypothetical protein
MAFKDHLRRGEKSVGWMTLDDEVRTARVIFFKW